MGDIYTVQNEYFCIIDYITEKFLKKQEKFEEILKHIKKHRTVPTVLCFVGLKIKEERQQLQQDRRHQLQHRWPIQ